MSNDGEYVTHEIVSGLNLLARHDIDEDYVADVLRRCKFVAMGRDAAVARLKECINRLAEIDEACGGDDRGLSVVSESIGWTSNYRTHSTEDYRRAMLALVEILDDEDVGDSLDVAEFELKRAMAEHASKAVQ
jgi:hypothetical protein